MRTVIVGLALLALTVSVVLAANPAVDGNIAGDAGWQGIAPIVIVEGEPTDPNELLISDVYDIGNAYIRSSEDNLTLFGGFEVYSDSMILAENASISFGFDTDGDSGTGGPVDSGACPNIGAEYRHDYLNVGSGDYINRLKRWTGTAWEYHADALAAESPDYEMAVEYTALGLTEPKCMGIGIYFENRAEDPDDSVCFTWCPENGGGEGCTPGYWKQPQHEDSWVNPPYDPDTSYFDVVFDVDCEDLACEGKTLLEVLETGGGGEMALGRHAVAALLNAAANSGVDYLYTTEGVIQMVKDAYDSGEFEWTKDLFEYENELGCPLN